MNTIYTQERFLEFTCIFAYQNETTTKFDDKLYSRYNVYYLKLYGIQCIKYTIYIQYV